jgi:predicted kinase
MSRLSLVAVSGLPGVGKSELVRGVAGVLLGLTLFEIDRIEAPLLRRGISGDAIGFAGYEILTSLAEDNLELGRSVLLDSVCWTRRIRLDWAALASEHNAAYRPIEVVCSDPAVHRARLERRDRSGRGLTNPTWEQVQQNRALYYEPWDSPRLVLDSVEPLNALLGKAIAYIQTP